MAETIVGNVGTIVSVALKVKEAVETVRQNEKECGDIAKLVARNGALLKQLEEATKIRMDTAVHSALEDLAGSLNEALKIVTECQRRHIIRRFLGAGDMAKELRRVQEDIVRKIIHASFATNIQMTIIMTHVIQHAGAPPPPRPQEQVATHIAKEEGFKEFSLYELKAATNDFVSDKNIIRRGGSAVIYKGVLRNGLVVAIKKFSDQPRNERSADNTWSQSGYSSKGPRKKGMLKGSRNYTLSGYSGRTKQPRNGRTDDICLPSGNSGRF